MSAPQITIKTTPKAQQMLRLIAAHTGEKHYEVLECVLRTAWARLQKATQA